VGGGRMKTLDHILIRILGARGRNDARARGRDTVKK